MSPTGQDFIQQGPCPNQQYMSLVMVRQAMIFFSEFQSFLLETKYRQILHLLTGIEFKKRRLNYDITQFAFLS